MSSIVASSKVEQRNQIYEKLSSKESLINILQHQKDSLTISNLVKVLDDIIQAE